MIRFKCIYCGQKLLAKDDGFGKKGKCPKCAHLLTVPALTVDRPAISSDNEPQIPMSVIARERIKELCENMPEKEIEAQIELFKENLGFLVPTYDRMSLFLMAVTWILLFIMNNELNKSLHTFIFTWNWLLIIYVLIIPSVFLVIGIYQIFIKREKSYFEKTTMLWFAIATNALTGIIAAAYIMENTDVRNWQVVFPLWNIVNAVLLYLMLFFNFIDERCIIDRRVTSYNIIFGLVAAVSIILMCNYVFKLYWAITFSICIVYTTSFDRGFQSVFPACQAREPRPARDTF